jgi:hypothetical protein
MSNQITETKKERTDEYNKALHETLEACGNMKRTAEKTIPTMWKELMSQGYNREQGRAIIEQDLAGVWGEWSLIKFLPVDAMHPGRRKGGLASGVARAEKIEKRRQDQGQVYPHMIVILAELVDQIVPLSRQFKKIVIEEKAPGEVIIRGLEAITNARSN